MRSAERKVSEVCVLAFAPQVPCFKLPEVFPTRCPFQLFQAMGILGSNESSPNHLDKAHSFWRSARHLHTSVSTLPGLWQQLGLPFAWAHAVKDGQANSIFPHFLLFIPHLIWASPSVKSHLARLSSPPLHFLSTLGCMKIIAPLFIYPPRFCVFEGRSHVLFTSVLSASSTGLATL